MFEDKRLKDLESDPFNPRNQNAYPSSHIPEELVNYELMKERRDDPNVGIKRP